MDHGGVRGKNIQTVGNLLLKYKNLKAPQGTVVQVCIKVVYEVCGFALKKEYVRYNAHNKTLSITLSGPAKTELLLRKKQILEKCSEELGSQTPQALI
ncbi:DciA family protein [Patescibacteria group bacterium]|nr:DciA family protein [Patescibacteria group bacterium]